MPRNGEFDLTHAQIALLRRAACELQSHRLVGYRLEDGTDSHDWMNSDGLRYARLDHERDIATAFTTEGARLIARLAEDIRDSSAIRRRSVSPHNFSKWIAREIAQIWSPSTEKTSDTRERLFEQSLNAWFSSHSLPRTHFVPCAILRDPAKRFALGPVSFVHRTQFDATDHGVHSDIGIKHHFQALFEHMDERGADWIACVEVLGRELDQSTVAADLAVDVALCALQIAFGVRDAFRRFARTTGRMLPPLRYEVARGEDAFWSSSAWQSAGFAISVSQFDQHILRSADILAAAGRRLSAYLAGTGTKPILDEAWCNAIYWYHEAVAEQLDTVSVAKLETSIEVLLRAESTKGSSSRFREGIQAFFGLARYDHINPRSTVTVDELISAITRSRSQILHGTWPTLGADLPAKIAGSPIVFADVEHLARSLLIETCLEIDLYAIEVGGKDDVESFLFWVSNKRRSHRKAEMTE